MVLRYSRLTGVVLVVFVLGTGRYGHAAWEYGLSATSSTGVTDNAASQSSNTGMTGDGFETAQGRLQLRNIGQFAQSQIAYGLSATTWFRGTQGLSLSHMVTLGSTIEVGPMLSVALNGSATLTQLSMLDTSTDPQSLGPRPAGNQEFLTLQAGESVIWQPGPSWRVGEGLQGRLYRPVNSDVNTGANKSLTLDAQLSHVWTQDSAGLRASLGEVWPSATPGTVQSTTVPAQLNSQFANAGLSWTHQWTQEWMHALGAGIALVRFGDNSAKPAPSASASVTWRRMGNYIELEAGQSADSNIYVGTAYERRFVALRVGVPINRTETLRLMVDGNAEHDWTTISDGTQGGSVEVGGNVYAGRASLSWQAGAYFRFALEYSIRDQHATSSGQPATSAGSTPSPFISIRRQLAMLTIEAVYPGLR